MGIFSDRQVAFIQDARIEIQGSISLLGGKFRLLLRGEQVDEATCNVGSAVTLRGQLKLGDTEQPVEAEVTQGWLGTRFHLRVAGQEQRLQRMG
ncbi:hypothetical protein [Hyalangium rubrum]|uniref:Polymer-forming cytoskeletal protein n=1 Tax=Hyalangium rubrum TaxID=3103134 RepID=A0ABU5HHP3_9BACT|nr:hypothetical protein [Hyalangium sp. s54d21]MDY7232970.1 hypothetical protein [Hyalangium sp. s54d21]